MMRALRLGLAGLALMVAPFSEATAQEQAAGAPTEQVAPGAPVEGPADEPVSGEAPGVEPGASEAVPAEPAAVLAVPGRSGPTSGLAVPMDDLSPGAEIVKDGQPLGIEEAVAMAIRNGLNVEVERFGPLVASAQAASAWGAYDPTVFADAFYDVIKAPNTFLLNPVQVNRDRIEGGSAGLQQRIPYLGASFDARFASTSTVTRSRIQQFDPLYNSSFFLSANVPLLRNFVWNETWTNVKIAGSVSEAAEQQFRIALMDNVQFTVNSYWGLVAARDRVRVAQKSLETARALLDQTRTQYEVGVVSQVEVVEAEAGVANREFELIQTANSYRNAQDVLIDAILGTELKAQTDLQIVPTADLTSYEVAPVNVENAVQNAFNGRPELQLATNAIEQSEMNLRFAKSQRLPQLDLQARYGFQGIAGDVNGAAAGVPLPPGFPPPVQQTYGESVDDFFTGQGADNYRIQGVFSVPIPNTTGRKQVASREFELRRNQTSRVRLEQQIILEVRAATRTLLAASQGIEAAERRRLAAEEQLRAERIRLEHGESTPFEVLQREEDLVEAESQKINALQLFHAAETALERSQGTILDAHSIEVDAARKPVR